eukprot:12178728-Alexandrium_andersonii.AAC.1
MGRPVAGQARVAGGALCHHVQCRRERAQEGRPVAGGARPVALPGRVAPGPRGPHLQRRHERS